MRGNNQIVMNQETLKEAISEYIEKRRASNAPKQNVTLVTPGANSGTVNVYIKEAT